MLHVTMPFLHVFFSVYFAPCNYDDTGHTDILSRCAHVCAEAFYVFHVFHLLGLHLLERDIACT